jgi:hypothetical protein
MRSEGRAQVRFCFWNLRGFEARVFLAGMRRVGLVLDPARIRSEGLSPRKPVPACSWRGCAGSGWFWNLRDYEAGAACLPSRLPPARPRGASLLDFVLRAGMIAQRGSDEHRYFLVRRFRERGKRNCSHLVFEQFRLRPPRAFSGEAGGRLCLYRFSIQQSSNEDSGFRTCAITKRGPPGRLHTHKFSIQQAPSKTLCALPPGRRPEPALARS